MNFIINHIKKLFCCHDYHIVSWHWCYKSYSNIPYGIEYTKVCKKCGHKKTDVAYKGTELEECLERHTELME